MLWGKKASFQSLKIKTALFWSVINFIWFDYYIVPNTCTLRLISVFAFIITWKPKEGINYAID